MRWWRVFKANVQVRAFCIRDMWQDLLFRKGYTVIKPPLLVYTRYSVEPFLGQETRHISAGYWTRPMLKNEVSKWVDFKVFFHEEYDQEKKEWIQTIPTLRRRFNRTPWHLR
jgi:hypothetical protein